MATVMGNPHSTCTQVVLFSIHETNAPVSLTVVDFTKGAHKHPDYISNYHPFGKVPVFVDNNYKLIESRAIARYINDNYNGHLIPTNNPQAIGIMNQWIHIEHGTIHTEFINILLASVWAPYKGLQPNDEAARKAIENLTTAFNFLEKQLSDGREYIAGDFSLVDIYFAPYLHLIVNKTEYGKMLFESRPKTEAWFQRVTARSAWKQTLAHATQ